MGEPAACEPCLRRAWLVGALAPMIEKVTDDAPQRRKAELLRLPDEELARAVAPGRGAADGGGPAGTDNERRHSVTADEMRRSLTAADAWACCRHDQRYPRALRDDCQAPPALLGRGDPRLLEVLEPDATATVVGSRRPSAYGGEVARRIGGELASAGIVVVSGMAMGIDSAAHRGALDRRGLTIAVLGSGPDVAYPRRERKLYEQIVERGLVLSELPPGSPARRWTFPARNRIMAALGRITIVVEGGGGSGSLITATMAMDLGREVGAVPGRVGATLAEGTNELIRDGAALIRGGEDVIDSLAGAGVRRIHEVTARPRRGRLEPALAAVLELVERGHETVDAIASEAQLSAADASSALTRLELAGRVRSDAGGRFQAAGDRAA